MSIAKGILVCKLDLVGPLAKDFVSFLFQLLMHLFHPLSFFSLHMYYCQVRRTQISERMRKLQELVTNMDKVAILFLFPCTLFEESNGYFSVVLQQMNIADMLDLAVEYIKDL